MQDNKTKLIGLTVIGLLAVGGTGGVVLLNRQQSSSNTSTTTASRNESSATQDTSTQSTSGTSTGKTYKDGNYTANGTYRTPGGNETIEVKLTLASNKITSVSVSGDGDGDSAEYQQMFEQGISSAVVGKSIDEANVSRVSGSSLTSTGFNNALDTIKQQAATA